MGISAATLTSIGLGQCTSHSSTIAMSGSIIEGSPNVIINGLSASKLTNIVIGDCGHIGIIVDASTNVNANSLGVAYLTSIFVGAFSGIIVSGSFNVNTGL